MPSGTRMSWQQKYTSATPAKVKRLEKPFGGVPAGSLLFIPSPPVIDAYLRAIPAGQSRDLVTMRRDLAKGSDADASCPVATSIYLKVVAEWALEQANSGMAVADVAPFWRVLDADTPLSAKLSCGTDFIRLQRELEGVVVSDRP
jgi:hypothetical protein